MDTTDNTTAGEDVIVVQPDAPQAGPTPEPPAPPPPAPADAITTGDLLVATDNTARFGGRTVLLLTAGQRTLLFTLNVTREINENSRLEYVLETHKPRGLWGLLTLFTRQASAAGASYNATANTLTIPQSLTSAGKQLSLPVELAVHPNQRR